MSMLNGANLLQEIMCRFRQISPDGSECGCMKAIILFTPGNKALFRLRIMTGNLSEVICRNVRIMRRAAGRNVARSSSVHPGRLRKDPLSQAAYEVRPIAPAGSHVKSNPVADRGAAFLQGDHRRNPHNATAGRHVLHGEKFPLIF